MAPRKKNDSQSKRGPVNPNAVIENAGVMVEQPITETLEKNYMPYAMSVILSRAIPEIDGFKPSHRKLLYTMYKMGLLTSARTKSANVVGQTMRLNPHGDAAIYETLVRLSRGYEALLYPYVDSKGNFGKAYSRDMAYAASRYTEVKLEKICQELFSTQPLPHVRCAKAQSSGQTSTKFTTDAQSTTPTKSVSAMKSSMRNGTTIKTETTARNLSAMPAKSYLRITQRWSIRFTN